MEAPMKFICLLGLLVIVVSMAGLERVDGASACGKSSPDNEAMKLAPCATAAQDEKADVSDSCCLQVKKIGQSLRLLSPSPSAATSLIVQRDTSVDVSVVHCYIYDHFQVFVPFFFFFFLFSFLYDHF